MIYETFIQESSIVEYLTSLKKIDLTNCEISNISTGINFVWTIKLQNENSFVLKQFPPHFRINKEKELSQDRFDKELYFYQLCEKLEINVPSLIHFDNNLKIIIIKFINSSKTLNQALLDFDELDVFYAECGLVLSKLHFFTSAFFLDLQSNIKTQIINLLNPLNEHTMINIFDKYNLISTNANKIIKNNNLMSGFKFENDLLLQSNFIKLKYKFINQHDCIMHGDFRGNSFLISEKNFLIDGEFLKIGPFGFDMGSMFYTLVAHYMSNSVFENIYKNKILEGIVEIWTSYEKNFNNLLINQCNGCVIDNNIFGQEAKEHFEKYLINNILNDAVGYLAVQIFTLMLPLSIVNEKLYTQNKEYYESKYGENIIHLGKILLLNYGNFASIDSFIKVLRNY